MRRQSARFLLVLLGGFTLGMADGTFAADPPRHAKGSVLGIDNSWRLPTALTIQKQEPVDPSLSLV